MTTRYATVKGARSEREAKAYLPENYRLLGEYKGVFVIAGEDVAGWTLDGYVIPRYGSGLMACREIWEAPF
jgi:hypothetical protein